MPCMWVKMIGCSFVSGLRVSICLGYCNLWFPCSLKGTIVCFRILLNDRKTKFLQREWFGNMGITYARIYSVLSRKRNKQKKNPIFTFEMKWEVKNMNYAFMWRRDILFCQSDYNHIVLLFWNCWFVQHFVSPSASGKPWTVWEQLDSFKIHRRFHACLVLHLYGN